MSILNLEQHEITIGVQETKTSQTRDDSFDRDQNKKQETSITNQNRVCLQQSIDHT